MSNHPQGPADNPDVVHEESDINVRAIIWFMVVLTVIVLTVDVAMYGLFRLLNHMERVADPVVSSLAIPAGQPLGPPGLQTTPWADLKEFKAGQAAYLHGYGWVDETAGMARVPIDKAKEMLLKKGLPVSPELADSLEGTHVAASGESNGGRTIPAAGADKSTAGATAPTPPTTPPSATMPPAPGKPGGGL